MKWFKFTLALLLAAALLPRFQSTIEFSVFGPSGVSHSGEGDPDHQRVGQARIEQDRVGPVKLMLAAGLVDILKRRSRKRLTDNTTITGGPDEHFAKFLERIGDDAIGKSLSLWNQDAKFSATIFLLLRESNRAAIEDYLQESEAQRSRAS